MIIFEFGGKKYSYPETLDEIKLGKFITYEETIGVKKPQSLRDLEEIEEEEDRKVALASVPDAVVCTEWFEWFVSFICYWSDMDKATAAQLPVHEAFWLHSVINRTIGTFQFRPEHTSFKVGDTVYHYPKEPINLLTGKKEPLKGSRIIEIIEAFQFEQYADQISKSQFGVLPFIIGLLCRKEDEQLPINTKEREDFIGARAKIMREISMREALNFSFFLPMLNHISKSGSNPYLKRMSGNNLHSRKPTLKRFGNGMGGIL